jgi:MFS family permease
MKTHLLIASACLLALLSTIGAALPYPILPPLFAAGATNGLNTFLGLPPKLLFGLALTINPLGLLIGSALLGPMSDRYGRRPVLLVTAVGAAIGHAVTAGALIIENYPLFIVARFATGLLEGSGSVARALLADRLDGDLRRKALSWLNGAFYMGWLAGPLLAGATLQFGITTPFWVAVAALLLVAALVAVTLPREAASHATTSWWQVARDQHSLNLLREPDLRSLFIVTLAYTCGVTAFYEFYPLWLVEVPGYSAQGIAWVTAAMCAVMTATTIVAGRPFTGEPLLRAPLRVHGSCDHRPAGRQQRHARPRLHRPVRHPALVLQRHRAQLLRRTLRRRPRPGCGDGLDLDHLLSRQHHHGAGRRGADADRHPPDPAAGRRPQRLVGLAHAALAPRMSARVEGALP